MLPLTTLYALWQLNHQQHWDYIDSVSCSSLFSSEGRTGTEESRIATGADAIALRSVFELWGQLEYFTSVADKSGFSSALSNTFRDLRASGIEPVQLTEFNPLRPISPPRREPFIPRPMKPIALEKISCPIRPALWERKK